MENKKNETNRKEIDLIELFSLLGQNIKDFVVGIYNALWWLFAFGIKNYITILVLGIIGLGYGAFHAFTFIPSYESQMKIRTNAMRSYEMKPYFEEITTYLSERNDENSHLAEELFDMDSASLSKILSVSSHYYIDVHGNGTIDGIDLKGEHSLEDTINIRDSLHLCIIAKVTDPMVFPKINSGIEHYIRSKSFIQQQNAYRLEEIKQNRKDLMHEVDYLDSLQKVVYFNSPNPASLRQSTSGYFLGNVSVQLFHSYKKNILDKIRILDKELNLHPDSYTVLSDFKISTHKTTSNIMLMIKPAVYLGFLGYILALLIYFFRKNYKKYAAKID